MNSKSVKLKDNLLFEGENNLMTVIAGIKFDNGIVVASDSQGTKGNYKKTDEKKITENEVKNLKFIFAGAGDSRLIKIAREQLISMCFNEDINSLLHLKNVCENVSMFIRKRYVDDDTEYPNLEFFVGALLGGKLGLFRIYHDGVAEIVTNYDVIGSGEIFADYIYTRLDKENLDAIEAVNTVLYVVEEIKEIDPNCGGETAISILLPSGFFKYENMEKVVNDRSGVLQSADDAMKPFWQKMIRDPFKIPGLDSGDKGGKQKDDK